MGRQVGFWQSRAVQPTSVDIETVLEQGQCVYALSWDTREPLGGSGSERIYLLNDAFVVVLDDSEDCFTYPTLHEAITSTEQLYAVGPATTTIESTQLSTEDILAFLKPLDGLDESELRVNINGEVCKIKAT
jgi:hypothetical protein